MSNYTKDNLIPLTHDSVPKGTLAIKIGDEIFTPNCGYKICNCHNVFLSI